MSLISILFETKGEESSIRLGFPRSFFTIFLYDLTPNWFSDVYKLNRHPCPGWAMSGRRNDVLPTSGVRVTENFRRLEHCYPTGLRTVLCARQMVPIRPWKRKERRRRQQYDSEQVLFGGALQ